MTSLNDIRSTFLDYFRRLDHEIVPSSPLVPRNDPTLMFTNAGMVQFKNVFTGLETRPYKRAATAQKCVRAGGKHNDLDNVGYTARHHTFFEMLGNFSFGDYFKEAAIPYAWDLVTKEFGLPKDRLLVTIYHTDDEAAEIWKKHAGLPDERIIRIATADNFWSMGPTGPCGPCSEIFYDHGPEIPGGPPGSEDEDGDRFIEIWNLVFMQFEQFEDGTRKPLPRPSIDTGMGLERIGAVLQGVHDNYDTDLFRRLIEASAHLTGTEPQGPGRIHHRVIADHIRAVSFLIADGVLPSNEGRGYVLRRIMRRAMRHAYLLGAQEPLMHRLVPVLVAEMGQAYPELVRAQALIEETLKLEETRFRGTLERGLRLLEDALARLPEGAPLPGEIAFRLYDTYGFPLDLTQDALREKGRTVDVAGFEAAMAEQRARARAAWAGSGERAEERLWFDIAERVGATDFIGYDEDEEKAEGQIQAIVAEDGAEAEVAEAGSKVAIVLNQTPFYAEAGGQVGDTGWLVAPSGKARITDTKKHAGLHVHHAEVVEGAIAVGEAAELEVDHDRRRLIRANHSATHLLNEALRQNLGQHVAQRGSLNDDQRLRFDFSHPKALTREELDAVEAEVNAYIRQNSKVQVHVMGLEEARALGAQALFGEKYGEEVRVISMGVQPGSGRGLDGNTYSIELCGGTHVRRTGDIGQFVIVGESAVAAGIRRIEALTGEAARRHMAAKAELLAEAAAALKAAPAELPERIRRVLEERRRLQEEVARLKRELALAGPAGAGGGPEPREIGGVRFLAQVLREVPGKELRALVDEHKKRLGSGVVLLISDTGGKAAVAAGVTDDLTGRISAVDLVRAAVETLGGRGGGGRPDLAQGGGADPGRAEAAIEAAARLLEAA
ncbi:MAG: alanine--tRNA ligase [Alphaproteobacteria bacterium]|nr:MAG: alanine--tRNA ligase [Alphaproteobacteria bacterium]